MAFWPRKHQAMFREETEGARETGRVVPFYNDLISFCVKWGEDTYSAGWCLVELTMPLALSVSLNQCLATVLSKDGPPAPVQPLRFSSLAPHPSLLSTPVIPFLYESVLSKVPNTHQLSVSQKLNHSKLHCPRRKIARLHHRLATYIINSEKKSRKISVKR